MCRGGVTSHCTIPPWTLEPASGLLLMGAGPLQCWFYWTTDAKKSQKNPNAHETPRSTTSCGSCQECVGNGIIGMVVQSEWFFLFFSAWCVSVWVQEVGGCGREVNVSLLASAAGCWMHHDEAFSWAASSSRCASHFFIWIIWYLSDGSGICWSAGRSHPQYCLNNTTFFSSSFFSPLVLNYWIWGCLLVVGSTKRKGKRHTTKMEFKTTTKIRKRKKGKEKKRRKKWKKGRERKKNQEEKPDMPEEISRLGGRWLQHRQSILGQSFTTTFSPVSKTRTK